MRIYFRTIFAAGRRVGAVYYIYLMLCLSEVFRNVGLLMSMYFGMRLFVLHENANGNLFVAGIITSVSCELIGVMLNGFMNETEKRAETIVYNSILKKCSKLPYANLNDGKTQAIIRETLEEGKESIVLLLSDLSFYIDGVLSIMVYFAVLSRVGYIFTLINTASLVFIVLMFKKKDSLQELRYKDVLIYRSRRKYYDDLYDEEVRHSEVTVQNASSYFADKTYEANKAFEEKRNSIRRHNYFDSLFAFAVSGLFVLGGLVYLMYKVKMGSIGVELFSTVVVCNILCYLQISKIAEVYVWDKEALIYAKEYFDYMDMPEETIKVCNSIADLEIRGMDYAYSEKLVLHDISVRIKRGERLLLIGENGAGKTTLLNVLSGIISSEKGDVLVNGAKIDNTSDIRSQVAYVSQNCPSMKISIRENFLREDVTDADIEKVLRDVDLWNSINRSPKGLDSVVGTDIELSKGQWQRFMIARLLLYKDRSVWIIDEPTSAMDAIHEDKIMRTVFEAAKDKVLIVVTHRMGFARLMTQIVHLKEGRVDYSGTHEQLYNDNNDYRQIYDLQSQMYD